MNLPWLEHLKSILPALSHHCLLFQGLAYTGVKELAFFYADALLKKHNQQPALLFHKHPDCYAIFEPTGVDELVFLNNLAHQPHAASAKIILIDLEKLSLAAMHVLLKSLEEPPAFVHFVLYQTNLRPVLATIASRALKINVPAPSFEVGLHYLKQENHANQSTTLCELLAEQPLWLANYDLILHDLIINYMLLSHPAAQEILAAKNNKKTAATANSGSSANSISKASHPLMMIDFLKKIGDSITPQINFLIAHIIQALILSKLNIPLKILSTQEDILKKIAEKYSMEKLEKLWQMILNWNYEPKIAINHKMVLAQFFSFYHGLN